MFDHSAGAIALVGSGEYLPVMDEIDRALLATLPKNPLVALLPTASGLEPGSPERWNRLGMTHFSGLGVETVALELLGRQDAFDQAIQAALTLANFFYFSGGNPNHLVETLQGTPAWDIMARAHGTGAVIAGCSAGAMMLGGYTVRLRGLMTGEPPSLAPALGVVPNVAVLPHFDRFAARLGLAAPQAFTEMAPEKLAVLGIDEDTALVRLLPDHPWQVMGRQTVTVFRQGLPPAVFRAGEAVALPER